MAKKTKTPAPPSPLTAWERLSPLEWIVGLIGAARVADHACCAEADIQALLSDPRAALTGAKRERIMAFAERQHSLTAAHPANLLLALRHAAGLTAHEVSSAAGMRASVMNRIEGGHQIPSMDTLARLFEFWRSRFPLLHLEDLCHANADDLRHRVAAWLAEAARAEGEAA